MPSKNDPESQPPDLFSSVETRAMLEEFRELVRAGILRVTPENEVLPVKPPSSGTERDTPESREEDVALLDKQLLEWMERRRAQKIEAILIDSWPCTTEAAAERRPGCGSRIPVSAR